MAGVVATVSSPGDRHLGQPRGGSLRLHAVDPEPGEEIFFHGHPSWRSLALFYVKGLVAALVAGVIAGIVTRIADKQASVGWRRP